MNQFAEILNKSGNKLHVNVINHLRKNGWETIISPYYLDGITSKPRELDIIAVKYFEFKTKLEESRYIRVRFFIECKYLSNPSIVWVDDIDKENSTRLVNQFFINTSTKSKTYNHRYKDIKIVGKMFDDDTAKDKNNKSLFLAINQCLNGYIYGKFNTTYIDKRYSPIYLRLDYPLIITDKFDNFKFLRMNMEQENIENNFLFEVNYVYRNKKGYDFNKYFLIDIVDFSTIDKFLGIIKIDADKIASNLSKKN